MGQLKIAHLKKKGRADSVAEFSFFFTKNFLRLNGGVKNARVGLQSFAMGLFSYRLRPLAEAASGLRRNKINKNCQKHL